MEFKEITELIKLINKLDLTEFKMKDGDFELSVRTKKYVKQIAPKEGPAQSVISIPAPAPAVAAPAPVAVAPAPAPVAESAPVAEEKKEEKPSNLVEIKSPIVGTFYRSASPDKPPYVKVGDVIEPGTVVCIIEAMKLFNEIESEISGKIVKVFVEDASPIEYDQVLFLVDPEG